MKKITGKRTWIAVALALMLAFALAACGGAATGDASGGAGEDAATEGDAATGDESAAADEGAGGGAELTKITFVLDWTPNTNHTGLYAAKELGYYEEAGLDVEIIQPSDNTAEQLVAVGQADFGISTEENVTYALTQDEPLPIRTVATVIQHNTSGFVSLPEEGIKSPKDWKGKTYGGWGSPAEEKILEYILKQNGLSLSDINIVTLGQDDLVTALKGEIDFAWIFEGWDGIRLQNDGIAYDYEPIIDIDPDLDFYTPTIITNTKLIEEAPDTVKAFIEATDRGYQYAIDDPEAAAQALLKAAPELDEKLVTESAKYLATKYAEGAPQWGYEDENVWRTYTDILLKSGLTTKELDFSEAFTNEFLPAK
jgi:ABC-type nitrate/sulfonate/bicarbonate transport system substrate-binding protein